MRLIAIASCAGLAVPVLAQPQQFFTVANTATGVATFNPQDGTLLNPSYIPIATAAYDMGTIKGAIQVGDEIWIPNQTGPSTIWRFDLNGHYFGRIDGNMNNIRTARPHNGVVYVTNDAAAGLTPANSVIRFDYSGTYLSNFAAVSGPYDVLVHNGELLVSNSDGAPDIGRFDIATGASLGAFHDGGMAFAQQMTRKANGNLLVAAFTSGRIFELSPAGVELAQSPAVSSARGARELGNGNVLCAGSAVSIWDTTAGTVTQVLAGSSHYVESLTVDAAVVGACCMPNGSCQSLSLGACGTQNGVFRGAASVCGTAVCPAQGACCLGDGTCQFVTGHGCVALGGIYAGDTVACAAANCPQPGACCQPDGTCSVVLPAACTAAGATFQGPGSACGSVTCPVFLATPNPTATSTTAGSGLFFDLTASSAVSITQIDYFPNSAAGVAVTADVYYKSGTYAGGETNGAAWTHVPTFMTTSVGGTTTPTALVLPAPISLAAGEVLGVYVVGTVGGIRYRASTSPNPVSNSSLSLESNVYRSALFGGTQTTGRRFAGWVHYTGAACYANCDNSTASPILNVQDFTCFLQKFTSSDAYANCDGSTQAPVLNVQDFTCFLTKYSAGCP